MKRQPWPYGQHATLKKIDELLADCGVHIHSGCGVQGCRTSLNYQRRRDQMLDLLKFEEDARIKGGKG